MPALKDLTGKVFGKLTVIERAGTGKCNKVLWLCHCSCGNESRVVAGSLLNGNTKSCGCNVLKKPIADTSLYAIGKRFGRLEVTGKRSLPSGKTVVTCKCDCGNEREAPRTHLQSGRVKSCGCLKAEQEQDLAGQQFGKLTVASESHRDKYGVHWKCNCECGGTTVLSAAKLRSVQGTRSCGCLSGSPVEIGGMQFGRLTAMYSAYARRNVRYWRCYCTCGRFCFVPARAMLSGGVQSCGCLAKEVSSKVASELSRRLPFQKRFRPWMFEPAGRRITMRSSYEAMWAEVLEARGARWEYEPETFKLAEGVRYIPDFKVYLPDGGVEWHEVKGMYTDKAKWKVEEFARHGHAVVVVTKDEIEAGHPMSCREFFRKNKDKCRHVKATVTA